MDAVAEYLLITVTLVLVVIGGILVALCCTDRLRVAYEQWRRRHAPKNRFRKEKKR